MNTATLVHVDGSCDNGAQDSGQRIAYARVTREFPALSQSQGNCLIKPLPIDATETDTQEVDHEPQSVYCTL